MRVTPRIARAGLLLAGGALLAAAPASAGPRKAMPLTTSSEAARESYLKGRELLENLRVQEARDHFLAAVAEDPEFAVAYLQLAGTQPSLKEFFESVETAQSLADRASEAERLWILGFVAGNLEGDPMRQREMYRRLVEAYPDDERAHNLLATNYFGQQEWELAVEEFERATALNPRFSAPYNLLGYAFRSLGRYGDAEKAFRKTMELIPGDPNPYDSYAELLMKMGRFDESIAQYEAALAIDPGFAFSHVGIASDLVYLGRPDEAHAQLRRLYDLAADDGQRRTALTNMAFASIEGGDFDGALERYAEQYALAEAIGDTSAMAGDLTLMGFALIEVEGREKEALDRFEAANALVEASSVSDELKEQNRLGHLFNSGRAYVALGELDRARAAASEFRRRVRAAQNSAQIKAAHQLDGLLALKEGDYDRAVEELSLADPQNPYVLYHLARAYEGRGDTAEAKRNYEKAATFNGLNSSPQAAIRRKAIERVKSM